ncbi:MAG: patatin-like phospholipase family protein [Polyangiaceae bacterium]|nr:patatin-like phospholipase family protein [Polyangiaceae bacterium]
MRPSRQRGEESVSESEMAPAVSGAEKDGTSIAPKHSKVALCLPGGGLTGALYQVGALAALEDGVLGIDGQSFRFYLGQGSGATVAAAIAGGISVERLYRALLDPADNFFPLDRSHILRVDIDEWNRAIGTSWVAVRHALARLMTRRDTVERSPWLLYFWEQVDRLNDSLPAGLMSLDRYEHFLAEFFLRRGIPNSFREMPRTLRIAAHDIDSGERVMFGDAGFEDVPVSLACSASLALPLFFSPVRIGSRHYLDGGLGRVAQLDVAEEAGAELVVVVNPLVPVSTANRAVPTGHGVCESVRDKGLLWVFNQAMRIGAHARLHEEVRRHQEAKTGLAVLILEPEPTDVLLFLHNPSNLAARRAILEYAYRTTRERIARWMERHRTVVDRMGWREA